MICYLIA